MVIKELKQVMLIQEQMEMEKKLVNMILLKLHQMKEKFQVVVVLTKMEEYMEILVIKAKILKLILNHWALKIIKFQKVIIIQEYNKFQEV
jgi:hypothetical protein